MTRKSEITSVLVVCNQSRQFYMKHILNDIYIFFGVPQHGRHVRRHVQTNSLGATGNFTYLLEGQIHFALKLSVGCPI